MTDHKADAALHYHQALHALNEWAAHPIDDNCRSAGLHLHLATLSAIREQTVELRRIADALGGYTNRPDSVNACEQCGHPVCQHIVSALCRFYDLQRPRNVEGDSA